MTGHSSCEMRLQQGVYIFEGAALMIVCIFTLIQFCIGRVKDFYTSASKTADLSMLSHNPAILIRN